MQQRVCREALLMAARPRSAGLLARRFGDVRLVTIDQAFGDGREAQNRHFADGGIFDRISRKGS